jgi:DNA-binding response OmpR family regulator
MVHRVLVVDDEVEGLAHLQAHLQPEGYAFTWALNAEEALGIIQDEPPDIIVIDAGLADQSAVELVTTLRKGDPPRHIPILLAIQKGDEEQRALARRSGADEVPGSFETLALTVCMRSLRLKAARDELAAQKLEIAGVFEGQRCSSSRGARLQIPSPSST